MNQFIHTVRERLTVDPNLAIDFVAMYSRFEYSLKVTTRFRQPGNGEAKANWKLFVKEVSKTFAPDCSPEITDAFSYLVQYPPCYLNAQNGSTTWAPTLPGKPTVETALQSIKQVRDNLFHGGKFALDPAATPGRDTQLLESSIVLMSELLSLVPEIEHAYLS